MKGYDITNPYFSDYTNYEEFRAINQKQIQIVFDNLVARANTIWTEQEAKIFFCALSRINYRDEKDVVTISKQELLKMLDLEKITTKEIRKWAKNLIVNSLVSFNTEYDGKGNDRSKLWEAGVLVSNVGEDRYHLYICFNDRYIPLLTNLKEYYTEINLNCLLSLRGSGAQKLYIYLASWYNKNFLTQTRTILAKDLVSVFDLSNTQFIRNKGTDKERFDFHMFEKRLLLPAIEEIKAKTNAGKCDLDLIGWEKLIEFKPFVKGYLFEYQYVDSKGFPLRDDTLPPEAIEDVKKLREDKTPLQIPEFDTSEIDEYLDNHKYRF